MLSLGGGSSRARPLSARDPGCSADGDHVVCAVIGSALFRCTSFGYWSVERQEPYVDAEASLKAEQGGASALAHAMRVERAVAPRSRSQ